MAKEWYVIHAYSGYENKVREALIERIERFEMQEVFGEIIVPSEEIVELKAGQERRKQRKFFPGYVLVNMELNDSSWHLIKDTPRVMGFIGGTKEKPSPISKEEADRLPDELYKIKGDTVIQKCCSRLAKFVYDKIASKRLEAINQMEYAIQSSLAGGNFEEIINTYFDSRFTSDLREFLYESTYYSS